MKTTKEQIYEYIQREIYTHNDNGRGIETKQIAERLQLQRSNVSSILNELVKEEKLIKTNTRPVYYKLSDMAAAPTGTNVFEEVIGQNGSLRNAIQLAKAAILYPQISQKVLLRSQPGCGTTFFASLLHKYGIAKGVFQSNAPYIKINCRHYWKNVSQLNEALFGVEGSLSTSCFARAKGGVLFIDNFDLMDAKQQARIYLFLESGKLFSKDDVLDCSDVFLILSCQPQNAAQLERRIPFVIELPELKDRSIEERFEFINHFFSVEASNAKRSITVNSEAIKALLLSEFANNVKEMEYEIKSACANGYVRVVSEPDKDIYVCINDFKSQIKRNLLKLRDNIAVIEELLGNEEFIFYDKNIGYQRNDFFMVGNIYNKIKVQYDELINRGISEKSTTDVIGNHLKNLFHNFSMDLKTDTINREQLSKIVDERIIGLVEILQGEVQRTLNKNLRQNIFYGLCLHVNSLLTGNLLGQRVSDEEIHETIQNHPQEYAVSMQFAMYLKEQLNLDLDTGEIVLITLFLIEPEEEDEHPVLLYIMHGNGTAKSLMEVTNSLTHAQNAYSYDMPLSMDTKQAMEEIKSLILKIDRGKGVIVVYDMGSINTMIETISEEIDVKIRSLNIPITLFGIDIARRCAMENDADDVYHMAKREIVRSLTKEERRNNILITLCHTGEGGAAQLKSYIDLYSNLGMQTIPLSISDRDVLLKEVLELKKTGAIHAFVGTYDPKLLGIPYIPIHKIFENKKEDLDRVLMFEPVNVKAVDYSEVYRHFEETFTYTSIAKLKSVLPNIMDEIALLYNLNSDQQLGLFVHIASLIERSLTGETLPIDEENIRIIRQFDEDYKLISRIIKPIEKAFKIIITDNEIAVILRIVRKI